jgi:hypothetical protein
VSASLVSSSTLQAGYPSKTTAEKLFDEMTTLYLITDGGFLDIWQRPITDTGRPAPTGAAAASIWSSRPAQTFER